MTKDSIRLLVVVAFFFIMMLVAYFIGNNNGKGNPREGYQYVKSERLDSLERAGIDKKLSNDSLVQELKTFRDSIENRVFTTKEQTDRIIKDERDELYNKKASRIDTLFIIGYDSAVGARRLIYN